MKSLPLLTAFLWLSCVSAQAQVPFERIRQAQSEPGNWLTYSGNYHGHRHSLLTEITPANVAGLKPAWVYQCREGGTVETSPIVVDGVIYITEKPHIVTALDGRTGRPLWTYRRTPVTDVPGCCGDVNRGVAILGDTLYWGTLDAHLIAIDSETGGLKWDVTVADYKTRPLRTEVWRHTMQRPESLPGVSGRFQVPASRPMKPGPARAGRPAVRRPGSRAATIPS
jgi:alcohol dehydrogenase (cytochrome c)